METYYEKDVKEQIRELYQPETSIPLAYKSEFSFKDKEDMYKEIYYNIDFFEQIIHEALQNFKKRSTKQYDLKT